MTCKQPAFFFHGIADGYNLIVHLHFTAKAFQLTFVSVVILAETEMEERYLWYRAIFQERVKGRVEVDNYIILLYQLVQVSLLDYLIVCLDERRHLLYATLLSVVYEEVLLNKIMYGNIRRNTMDIRLLFLHTSTNSQAYGKFLAVEFLQILYEYRVYSSLQQAVDND